MSDQALAAVGNWYKRQWIAFRNREYLERMEIYGEALHGVHTEMGYLDHHEAVDSVNSDEVCLYCRINGQVLKESLFSRHSTWISFLIHADSNNLRSKNLSFRNTSLDIL